jgi:hypothetical protein
MESETCPRCYSRSLRRWADLTEEQQMLAERLPASANYTPELRKKHRICTRCWFEDDGRREVTA